MKHADRIDLGGIITTSTEQPSNARRHDSWRFRQVIHEFSLMLRAADAEIHDRPPSRAAFAAHDSAARPGRPSLSGRGTYRGRRS